MWRSPMESRRTNRRWPTDTDGQLEALETVGSRKCSTRHISLYILIMNSVFFFLNSFLWHQLKSVLQHATVCVYVFDVYWCILMFRNRATSKPEAVLICVDRNSPTFSGPPSPWQAQIFQAAKRTQDSEISAIFCMELPRTRWFQAS